MLRKFAYGWVILLTTISCGANADVLHLSSDEALSGKMVRIAEGVLVFRTTLSGQMMVAMGSVDGLRTDQNLVIAMRDDSVHYGKLVTHNEKPHVLPLGSDTPQPIALAQIQEAMVLPSNDEEKERWDKRISTGLKGRITTDDALDAYARLELLRRGADRPELDLKLEAELADEDPFPRSYDASFAVRGQREGLAPYLQLGLERDELQALALRSSLSLGMGKYWSSDTKQSLYGGLGVYLSDERWERDYRAAGPFKRELRNDDTDLHLELQLRYKRALRYQATLENHLILLPSLSDAGDLRASNNTTITYPVSDHLKLRLDMALEYDAELGFSHYDRWNAGIGAGLQFDF